MHSCFKEKSHTHYPMLRIIFRGSLISLHSTRLLQSYQVTEGFPHPIICNLCLTSNLVSLMRYSVCEHSNPQTLVNIDLQEGKSRKFSQYLVAHRFEVKSAPHMTKIPYFRQIPANENFRVHSNGLLWFVLYIFLGLVLFDPLGEH